MKKAVANEFKDALNLDLHPIVTPNTVLTDNLNGTFITYNGNEFCLQNDMGNTSVGQLTEGYIPIGIKEYNGVLYIVSVNGNYTEIGTFPSPNWMTEGIGDDNKICPEIDLNYEYSPLYNVCTRADRESSYLDANERLPFRVSGLNYDVKHPITIEIQPSYDGSVNLILTDGQNAPRIVNSGFSVLPNNKAKIIFERNQITPTNRYNQDDIAEQLSLIRSNTTIANVDLVTVQSGGQFKGGNYKFYIKFGDSDYNQTDVVAESGIVSIFNGNDGIPSTISGTILDERTDKMIQLKVSGLNKVYSKIYIYYSREYSDTLGYRMTESGMFVKPIEMDDTKPENGGLYKTFWLTGFEETQSIDIEELNVDYHTIDSAKTQAQQANMLFLGNVGQSETFELYKTLKEKTLRGVSTTLSLGGTLNPVTNDFTGGKDYYSTHNIYYNLGYWPDEWYRFGIVYILKDGSTTPVFNMQGCIYSELNVPMLNLPGGPYNEYGIFKTPRVDVLSESTPLCFQFKLPNDLPEEVLGWFVVRQKRIPTTICQGLRIGVDKRSHLPITWNGKNWITQSFLSLERNFGNKDGETWREGKVPTTHHLYPMLEYNGVSASGVNGFFKQFTPENINYIIDPSTNSNATVEVFTGIQKQSYLTYKANHNNIYEAPNVNESFNGNPNNFVLVVSLKTSYKSNGTQFVQFEEPVYVAFGSVQNTFVIDELTTWGVITIDENKYFFGTINNLELLSQLEDSQSFGNPNKFIVYNRQSSLKGYGLLSLDPFVNHQIGSMLDGSLFKLVKEYNTTTSFGKAGNYISGNITNDNFLRIDETVNGFVGSDVGKVRCVAVPQSTGVKAIDNFAYSTVAGSASEAGNFKYAAEALGIYVPNSTKKYHIQDSAQVDTEEVGTTDFYGYNTTHNVNLIRGNFTPFVGLATDDLSHGIYSIRTPEIGNNAFVVRENDNSEYYTVSKRFDLSKNQINEKVYGGDCYFCTVAQRIITNFIDNTAPVSTVIVDPGCWEVYVRQKSRYGGDGDGVDKDAEVVDYTKVNISDVNTVDLGYWVSYKCLSSYNLGLRSVDSSHSDEYALMGSPRSFYPLNGCSTATGNKMQESYLLNDGLSATVGRKRYNLLPDAPYSKSEFANRIMFSNVHMTDAFTNGYRTFQGLSYKDYDKQYGEITKLVSWGQNIFIIMEHGLGLVPVNEKALMQTTTGEAIHIYGYGVLPNEMSIVSQDFGSKYEESVVRTPIGIYGIDTDARKIWRFTDRQGFETISDMKIESLLNDSLNSDYEVNMPDVDVRTFYNIFKGDLIFTWKDKRKNHEDICICFNERQNVWTTRYDWKPIISENKNGEFYSLQFKEIGSQSNQVNIWQHNVIGSNPTFWYNKQHGFEFEFVVSDPIGVNKIFDDIEIISNNVQPNEMEITVIGDDYMFKRDLIQVSSGDKIHKNDAHTTSDLHGNIQNTNFAHVNGLRAEAIRIVNQTGLVKTQTFKDIYKFGRRLGNIQYKEGVWHSVIEPFWYANKQVRIRDKWAKIRIKYSGENLAVITAIRTILNV